MRKAAAQMVAGRVARKRPWLPVWVACLSVTGYCAAPAGNPSIRLEGTEPSVEVILNADRRAELGFAGTVAYGVRLEQPSAPVATSLNCSAGPIALDSQWHRATGECQILFQAEQRPGQAVQTVYLRISSQQWPTSALSGSSPPVLDAGRLVEVRIRPLAFRPAPVPGQFSALTFAAGFFAAVILGGLAFYLLGGIAFYLHNRRPASVKRWADPLGLLHRRLRIRVAEEARLNPARDRERRTPPEPLTSPDPPQPARLDGHEQLSGILERLAASEEERDAALRARETEIAGIIHRASLEFARHVGALRDEARRLGSAAQAGEEQSNRLARIIDEAQKLEPKRLSVLLTAVPGAALDGPAAPGSATTLLERFDEAVRECSREARPLRAELDSLRATLVAAEQAIVRLLEAAGSRNDGPAARLKSVLDAIRQLREEMDAALGALDINRICLYFRLDLSTLPTTRQSLEEELADCLRKQVFRLEDPVGYFSMRYELTITQALQEVVDCCDSTLDPSRRDKALQDALVGFVAGAGAEWIDPQPGAAFVGVDHQVFGITPCAKPEEQSDHVSSLRVRGLKRQGQVLRKASVTIFV